MMAGSDRVLNRAQCTKLLRTALKTDYATVLSFELKGMGENLGFMGEHMILNVKYQVEKSDIRERSFFMKLTPSNERHYNFVVDEGLFGKEKEMYETVLPLMCEHLGLSKLPVPDCYFIKDNQFMIFEDLTRSGFCMQDKLVPLSVEFCRVALRAIAKYHAGSIAIEAKTGQSITKFINHNYEVLMVGEKSQSIASTWHKASLSTMFGFLQKMNVYRHKLEGKWEDVNKKLKEAWDRSSELAKTPSSKVRNVLCHGDLWLNNLLFRCDDTDQVCEASLVDFQIYRHVPPALDIVMFLHTTTTRDLRDKHMLELLLTYHEQLSQTLTSAGLQEHVLSLAEIVRSVHEYRMFGVVVAARYLPTCLKHSDEIEAVKQRLAGHSDTSLPSEFMQDSSDILVQSLDKCPARRARVLQAVDELLEFLQL